MENTINDGSDDHELFKEINELRNAQPVIDQEAIERAKLNDSVFGKIAASKKFEYTTLGIIVLNAGFIGYDADFSARNHKPADLYDCTGFEPDSCYQFIIFENLFATYFTAEVIIRFLSYRRKLALVSCDNASVWFIFDSVLVTLMVLETWILPIVGGSGSLSQLSVLRLLRLLRITRMVKLMRFFPELQIIVKGMIAAVRSVVATAVLLIGILYVASIIFTSEFHAGDKEDEEIAGTAVELFGSMGKSMRHLFIMGTILDDITLCCNYIRGSNKGVTMLFAFLLFVLLSSFTMLNMLVGILCEVVCATGEGERETITQGNVSDAICALFKSMDKDSDGEVTRDEFLQMKSNTGVMKALKALNVQAKHFEMYSELMFKPEADGTDNTMNLEEMISMIMRLKPDAPVSALDFASFQMSVKKNNISLAKNFNSIESMASVLTGLTPPSKDPLSPGLTASPFQVSPSIENMSEQDLLTELQYRMGQTPGSLSLKSRGGPPQGSLEFSAKLSDSYPAFEGVGFRGSGSLKQQQHQQQQSPGFGDTGQHQDAYRQKLPGQAESLYSHSD